MKVNISLIKDMDLAPTSGLLVQSSLEALRRT